MLTDAAALALAWAATRIAARPADTTSLVRLPATASARHVRQRLRAAVHRRVDRDRSRATPAHAGAGGCRLVILWIGALGFVVNLIVFAMLRRGDAHDMNIAAATLHVVGDLLGSAGGDRSRRW